MPDGTTKYRRLTKDRGEAPERGKVGYLPTNPSCPLWESAGTFSLELASHSTGNQVLQPILGLELALNSIK